jgi:hypothetical protein
MGLCYNFDLCFEWYRKAQIFVVNSMFVSFCKFSIILKYDEMNCNLLYGFKKKLFLNANFGYMK